MRIILKQDVPGLGALGDELQVKPGYARNFLIPQGLALFIGTSQSKALLHQRGHLEKMRKDAVDQAISLEKALKEQLFEIPKKTGENGRLFGSVTNRDLEELFELKGFSINRRDITIPTPIKNVGNHTILIKLHTEVRVELLIKVVADIEVATPTPEILAEEFVDESDEFLSETGVA